MPDPILTAPTGSPAPAMASGTPSATQLAKTGGFEVVGNWVIDRDFGIVRRRYWGKLPVEGPEYTEA